MIGGLDTLRVVALVLITWQHAASNLGYYEITQWHGISPGQIGVSVFCAISGLLAFHTKPASVFGWLQKRLARIFPAYWVATVSAFGLVLMTGIKKPSINLFVSQMLGLGFFTHGWDLINVVSWFISLLLLCYLIAMVSWISGYPVIVLSLVSVIAALMCFSHLEVAVSQHLLCFALAGLTMLTNNRWLYWMLGVSFFFIGLLAEPAFFYSGCSLLLLLLMLIRPIKESSWVRWLSDYSYQYFLLHGICLVGMTRVISNPFLSIGLAIVIAAVSSVVLHWICQPFVLKATRYPLFQKEDYSGRAL